MIKRSIFVCVAVILTWHLLMPRLPRSFYTIPGMQRSNYFHAQHFVHDTPADTKVIVGSSMSDRLSAAVLGKGHAKLTFPGGGPFTGLEIIRATGRLPTVLWIESNMILRDAEEDLLADVLSPWRRKVRDASPVLKEEGRPSNYGVGFLKAVVKKGGKAADDLTGGPTRNNSAKTLEPAAMDGIMAANHESHSKVPDAADLAKRAERMAGYVDALAKAGCKVVFFEMPIDASLKELAEPVAVRAALRKRFPDDKYHWLDLKRDVPYETTDGVHLIPADADFVVRKMLDFEDTLK